MRARAAFARWAKQKFGSDPTTIWDAATAGDLSARAAVAAWLAKDGLTWPESLPPAVPVKSASRWRLADRGQEPLVVALTLLRSRGIGFGQIVAARVGDFEPGADGKTIWNLRLRGYWPANKRPLEDDELTAVKVLAKWNRTEPSSPNEPLLLGDWQPYKLARLCKALAKSIDSDSTAA